MALAFSGPAERLDAQDFLEASARAKIDVALIQAVTAVEASTKGGFLPDTRPVVLFEAAHFDRLTQGRFRAAHPALSSPMWNRSLYAATPQGEWTRLTSAITLNRSAALLSASWGMFQIMGFNFSACGASDIEDYVNRCVESEAHHLEFFLTFLDASPAMKQALKDRRWDAFSEAYNGPSYRVTNYAGRLADAYQKALSSMPVTKVAVPAAPPPPPPQPSPPIPPPSSAASDLPSYRVVKYAVVARSGPGWWHLPVPASPIAPGVRLKIVGVDGIWSDVMWTTPARNVAYGWVDSASLEAP